jgi:hypothetical protein
MHYSCPETSIYVLITHVIFHHTIIDQVQIQHCSKALEIVSYTWCHRCCRNPSLGLATKARNSHVGSWSLERTPKFSERDCRGQNSSPWRVLYIIGKLLKCRCLKWACMAHLDIWNTSYGQKKGRESNWQFDSRPLKVGNWPDLLGFRRRATYRWKALDEGYNFALNRIAIRGLHKKLCALKVPRVPVGGISTLPRGSPGRKKSFGCGPRGESQSIL